MGPEKRTGHLEALCDRGFKFLMTLNARPRDCIFQAENHDSEEDMVDYTQFVCTTTMFCHVNIYLHISNGLLVRRKRARHVLVTHTDNDDTLRYSSQKALKSPRLSCEGVTKLLKTYHIDL